MSRTTGEEAAKEPPDLSAVLVYIVKIYILTVLLINSLRELLRARTKSSFVLCGNCVDTVNS